MGTFVGRCVAVTPVVQRWLQCEDGRFHSFPDDLEDGYLRSDCKSQWLDLEVLELEQGGLVCEAVYVPRACVECCKSVTSREGKT